MSVAVTELSGAEVAVVTLAICNGFADYDALGRFLLMKLDVKLAVLVEPTGLEKAAGVVIDWAEETGATPRLLAMLRRDTDNAALQTVIDSHGIRIEDFSQVAAGSLAGMQAVAADPATRAALLTGQAKCIRSGTHSPRSPPSR